MTRISHPASFHGVRRERNALRAQRRALLAERDELAAKLAAVEAAIDRADPPGVYRAGTPTVSVAVLRSILKGSA